MEDKFNVSGFLTSMVPIESLLHYEFNEVYLASLAIVVFVEELFEKSVVFRRKFFYTDYLG